tara:strand:+ start:68 stop:265 length:198 start_codon:yes stop_codon:yes gene_type:complete
MKNNEHDMIDARGFLNFLIERNLINPEEVPKNDEQLEIWFKQVRSNIDRTEAILMWMNKDNLPQA